MHRVFTVERATGSDKDHLQWWAIGTYSTEGEAIDHARAAKAEPGTVGVRVRQFWIQSSLTPSHAKLRTEWPDVQPDQLAEWRCPDHPMTVAKVFKGGTEPRCPECRATMVPSSFADAPIIDLTDLPTNKDQTK
jgi:hypothetical protein